MAKITSRSTSTNTHLEDLQTILIHYSAGAIGHPGSGATFDVGTTLDEVIDQNDQMIAGLCTALELIKAQNDFLRINLARAEMQLDVTQDALANLIGNIDYDDALDHAAADLMDCFCARGADVTVHGELRFDPSTTFSKEDVKPMLREAIVRWVELKMGQ